MRPAFDLLLGAMPVIVLSVIVLPVIVVPAVAVAEERPAFPAYDITAFCKTQANYSYAATLGDSSYDGVFASCVDREEENKTLAAGEWAAASRKAALECAGIADGRYSYLQRCLDGMRTTRVAR